jgi:hypothetical protein
MGPMDRGTLCLRRQKTVGAENGDSYIVKQRSEYLNVVTRCMGEISKCDWKHKRLLLDDSIAIVAGY